METFVKETLSSQIDRIRAQLCALINEGTAPEEGSDAQLLLDALAGADPATYLPRFETSGARLAQYGGKLEARLAGLQRYCEGLSYALGDIFAGDPKHCVIAQRRLVQLMGQIAIALARGFQRSINQQIAEVQELAHRGMTRLAALQRVNNAANSSLDLDQTLALTAQAVAEEMHADLCSIFLYDETSREVILRATNGPRPFGSSHFALRMGEGYSGWVADTGRTLITRDASADPRFAYEARAYHPEVRGLLSMPIIFYPVEKLEGVINVQTTEPREFLPEEVSFLEVVSGQLAMNIENGRLYEQTDEQLRRRIYELSTLHRVTALIASTLDLDEVLRTITMQAVHLSATERSIIFETNEDGQELRMLASYGLDIPQSRRAHVRVGHCCAGRTVQCGQPVTAVDCAQNDETCFFRAYPEIMPDIHSVLCVPLEVKRRILGVLCVYGSQRHLPTPDQQQLVVTFANDAAIAIENARLYAETVRGLNVKSTLLQEMHHRVKNNLQTVAALLSLQQRHTKSPAVARILGESVNRIQGIAATHDLLSREDIDDATVEELAKKIVSIASTNLVTPPLQVQFIVRPSDIRVSSRQATVLGIVLNELVSNAIKHGFANREQGRILIEACHHGEDVVVRVIDDGVGISPDFDFDTTEGLGTSLIRGLVGTDLHGTFSLRREEGPWPGTAPTDGETPASTVYTVAEVTFTAAR
jgi:two-component sensor histidine kinase/putative methionine-R-sulfoxide reductase with GAF domain